MGEAQGAASGQSGVGDCPGLGQSPGLSVRLGDRPRSQVTASRSKVPKGPVHVYSECVFGLLVLDAWGPGLSGLPNTHAHSTTPVRSWGLLQESCFPLSLESLPRDFGLGTSFWAGLGLLLLLLSPFLQETRSSISRPCSGAGFRV